MNKKTCKDCKWLTIYEQYNESCCLHRTGELHFVKNNFDINCASSCNFFNSEDPYTQFLADLKKKEAKMNEWSIVWYSTSNKKMGEITGLCEKVAYERANELNRRHPELRHEVKAPC